jgi:acyl-CoA thioester hydrolase
MIEPVKIQIRFSDCDMMGHVNNACFLNYFEYARMHYMRQVLPINWDWKKNGIILKTNEIEYEKPLYLNDLAFVYVKLEKIGTKSFTLAYELTVNNQIKTKGRSVIVCYNFEENKSIEVSIELKNALNKLTIL